MSSQIVGCRVCGHEFSDYHENYYFTKDHANYYAPENTFCLSWCRLCSRVSVFTRPKLARLAGLNSLKYTKSFELHEVENQKYYHLEDQCLGGIAGGHLLRMIWNSLVAKAIRDEPDKNECEMATHQAIVRLPASEFAFMAYMTILARAYVPLEQQIMEGNYIKDIIRLSDYLLWINSSPDKDDAAIARRALNNIQESCGVNLNCV